ncbi:molybdopterin-binding protein [Bradyrhizobium manausense]|uniref:molybdopterin-binding protein n=1 Tax=Bradyrhizobium TaxID=374 RepID=UPI001BA59DFB|nr:MULTISPECIES: molybdopterin-binding protein [Bradyrhizobium]MBR0830111.1 molybdopterin-binding protein [Bradyrhizobium manausense]UVO30914.1 molybdopterin-binding protein [Bradyrhizobium arachidis]
MTQRLPPTLTPLDVALAGLLNELQPVAPIALPLAEALGCIAAEMPALKPLPPHDVAVVDGWALRANDLVGASSYSPLPLTALPTWVESGDAMPAGCDCVLDADAVATAGPISEVLTEGIPGQGVRRAGSDIAAGASVVVPGTQIHAADLMLARAAGMETLNVRRPRLRIVNMPHGGVSARLIADHARTCGAQIVEVEAGARDAASITHALDAAACDLLLLVGGTGVGREDAAITALAARGEVLAHGIALEPGRTAATGRLRAVPVIALPGAPDHAFATWLALARSVLDRLSARRQQNAVTLPLARKIASSVGVAEVALLAEQAGTWLPLAIGALPLQSIARADAWLIVLGDSEGFAADTPVDAYLLRE